jgi:hypothetical protein
MFELFLFSGDLHLENMNLNSSYVSDFNKNSLRNKEIMETATVPRRRKMII